MSVNTLSRFSEPIVPPKRIVCLTVKPFVKFPAVNATTTGEICEHNG